ncbi:MAG TPA: hypothetical protein VJR47_13435 [Stellaceae bacterium]|nr:hypothetical protein [Stellaceae bacterium]
MTEETFDDASLCRALAAKWLETAERVDNATLKRCYEERALRYLALAQSFDVPLNATRH